MSNPSLPFRIGFGVDRHRLGQDLPLIIGGVRIPSDLGSIGHSDADVLLHAICDAILGAVNLRDIGYHFPDTDPAYKGIDSKILLRKSFELVKQQGYKLGNLDCTVMLEAPKVNPHIEDMQLVIADLMEADVSQISIKATRGEKVGPVGRREAIQAYATALVLAV